MHTLFLLDLNLSIKDALNYLLSHGLDKNTLCIACSQLGTEKENIKAGPASFLLKQSFPKPSSLIIPGKLHFIEQEALEQWQQKALF